MRRCGTCGKMVDNESVLNCPECGGFLEKVEILPPKISDNAPIHVLQSFRPQNNTFFCPRCGAPIPSGLSQCSKCGFVLPNIPAQSSNNQRKSVDLSEGQPGNQILFCPKCGNKIMQGETKCKKCGEKIKITTEKKSSKQENNKSHISILRLALSVVMAAFILYEMFQAADNVLQGGKNIMGIESVGGKTLEEAYYFYLGTVYNGYATVIRITGVFFASVLVLLGLQKQ